MIYIYIPASDFNPDDYELPIASERIQSGQRVVMASAEDSFQVELDRHESSKRGVGIAAQDAEAGQRIQVITSQIGIALEDIPKGGEGRILLQLGPALLLVRKTI